MRIQDKRGPQEVNVSNTAQTKKAAAKDSEAKTQSAASTADSVKVNVSAKAKALSDQNKVDEAKVARLREQVSNGSFKVDARAIATKLVGETA